VGTFVGVLVGVFVGGTGVLLGVLVGVRVGGTGVLVGVLLGVFVGVLVGTSVLVGVRVNVLVGGTGVLVGVDVSPTIWIGTSIYNAGLLTVLPRLSDTLLSRLGGAGGENCQCITPSPGPLAQKLICATLKLLPGGTGDPKVPDAYAISPVTLLTTFCSGTGKVEVSGFTEVEATQPARFVLTTCSRPVVNVI